MGVGLGILVFGSMCLSVPAHFKMASIKLEVHCCFYWCQFTRLIRLICCVWLAVYVMFGFAILCVLLLVLFVFLFFGLWDASISHP